MRPRSPISGLWIPAMVLAVTLLPASVHAQAGLSGDPFGGQEAERLGRSSQFDKGFQSKSALGQLEELTGTKVSRPSSQRTVVPRAAAQSRSVTPRFDANQMFKQELAGAVVGALFANLFSDDSAQQRAAAEAAAAQAAAQAAAEAEAFRVQQELARQARIRQAQHYRADWDSREAGITDRLGGAFDVAAGTSFFGRPANPDADAVAAILGQDIGGATQASGEVPDAFASDPSVVDLRGSSLVVQPFDSPIRTLTPGHVPAITRSTARARVLPRWVDDGPEVESAADPRNIRNWWTKWHPYVQGKVTDLELAYVYMGIKEMGGDSVQALASLPEKAKNALDLKKNLSEHITEYLSSIFSIAGQATDPGANYTALGDQLSDTFQASGTNFRDDANKGMSNNFWLRLGGTIQEGSPAEVGAGIAQGLSDDTHDLIFGANHASGGL